MYLSQAWEITDARGSCAISFIAAGIAVEVSPAEPLRNTDRNTLRFQSAAKFYFWGEPAKVSTAPEVAIELNNKTLFRRTSKTDSPK